MTVNTGGGVRNESDLTRTIFEKSKPGRRAFVPPRDDVSDMPGADELLPASAR